MKKLLSAAALIVGFSSVALIAPKAFAAEPKIEPDVVYGHKDGLALTFDVISPEKPNGAGVLSIQSGGWYSRWAEPKQLVPTVQPLLDKGFTVFIVRHGSSPKYAVPECVDDVRLSVRFIRSRAANWKVDPTRLGAVGGSAGGHLALMLATTGDDGNPAATTDLLKHSSRIKASVSLYPPTDLRGWVNNPPEVIKKLPGLKPSLTFAEAKEKDVSPVLHVTADDAAMLMIHGDKDELVPVKHSHDLIAAAKEAKANAELVVVEGAAHGYSPKQSVEIVLPAMVGWFEKYLAQP